MSGGPSAILLTLYRGDAAGLEGQLAQRPPLDVFEAAAVGDAEGLRGLVREDPGRIGAIAVDGWTPLHLAAFFGRGDAVDVVLAAGADPRAWSRNDHRNTALHAALAGRGDVRIVTALIARGADVNAMASGGHTPLHLAAFRGDLTFIEVLLARGAQALARTDDDKTSQAIAEECGHTAAARRLRGELP